MVQSGFTRKKVESLTLGEKLRKLRGDFRMSLPEISKATKIQVKYLELLENGEYEKLPADVYVRGFLRSYARYLNIDEQAFIKLYERERNIQENLGRDERKKSHLKTFSPTSIVVTSRSVVVTIIVLLVTGAFLYLYQEFKSFAAVPRLVILEPADGSVVKTSTVTLRGKTDKGARVSVNNQAVFVGSEGEFTEKIILQPGFNSLTIVTVNRFDKEKSETLSLNAEYTVAPPAPEVTEEKFQVQIAARTLPITVRVLADDVEVFNGVVGANETKSFEAKERLSIASNNGEETFVRFQDGDEVALSTEKGQTKEIVFLKSGKQE